MFCFDPTVGWSTIAQLVGFLVAIIAVVYQMKAQRRLQRDKHRVDLQARIYEKAAEGMSSVSPVGAATKFQIIHGALVEAVRKKQKNGTYVPPPFDPMEIDSEFQDAHTGLWRVASTIQTYEIVAPNLPLFREALIIKLCQLADAYLPLVRVLPYLLISENGIRDPNDLLVPDENDLTSLQEKINEFHETAYDVASFLHDIQVEMQNALLGELFQRKLPVRAPKDESYIVLTSGDSAMLNRVSDFVSKNQ